MSPASPDLESYLLGDADEPPAGLPAAVGAEAAVARTFASGDGAPPRRLGLEVTVALCSALAARGDTARLTRLAAEADKALAKEARRALHALRARGTAVTVPRAAARPTPLDLRVAPEPEPESIATSIDALGERGVWLCRRAPDGGVLVFEAVISDTLGLVEFWPGQATRKEHRALIRQLLGRDLFAAAVVPGDYARGLLEEAYRITTAAGRALPPSFARARSEMGPVVPASGQHPALERWPEAAPLDEREARALLDRPELRGWFPDQETLRRTALKLAEVDESRILVGEPQKAAARVDALTRELEAYFTPARRALFRRRLLDSAWLLHLRAGAGDEEAAVRLRAAAEAFVPGEPPPPLGALARGFFERPFDLGPQPAEEGPAGPPPGGLIVSPYAAPGATPGPGPTPGPGATPGPRPAGWPRGGPRR